MRYEYHGKRRTTPLFLNHSTLSTLSVEDFTFNVIQGIPFLASQLGITLRLSAVDGEDDVDLNNNRFLKVIMDIAKRSDKVYLNVYESATPFASTSSPPAKVSRSSCFTPVSTMAISKSNILCHTAKVEDKTYEDRREQGADHLYISLIEHENVEVGLDKKPRKQLDFLGSEEQNCSGASRPNITLANTDGTPIPVVHGPENTYDLPRSMAFPSSPPGHVGLGPVAFSSPLESLMNNLGKRVDELQQEVVLKTQEYNIIKARFSAKPGINYSKPACSICHKRPRPSEKGHNRTSCPTKVQCASATVCGDISRHPKESDELKNAKRQLEKSEKELADAKKEMELNKHVQERSFETKVMDKLKMEIPERYKTDDDENGFVQLNLDATRIVK